MLINCPKCGHKISEKLEVDIILYTKEDIQQIFKLGRDKTYQLMNSRGFPTIKIGRTSYVPKDKLEKWINGNVGKNVNI